jgi:hypothetical protein
MKHVHQAPSHYEVELRQGDHQDGQAGSAWRAIKRVGPDGTMAPLKFASLQTAQAYGRRMNRQEARIVAVERDGWRRTVNAGET